jgi:predicted membrane channel-forming protein YqfA (hemolysin III family)
MIERNKIIGWISFSLIVASVFLIILTSWLDLDNTIVNKLTIILGLLSVLFSIIVSSGLELGKSRLIVQMIVYSVVGITCIFFSLILFEVLSLLDVLVWFIMLIILSVVGIVILKVFAKKNVNDLLKQEKDMVKISKQEYKMLLDKASKYDKLVGASNEIQEN